MFFAMSLGTALFRTKSLANNNVAGSSVYINVEAHSIAFTCLCLWIIPAVMLGSVIGVSQTRSSFSDILRRFEHDLMHFDTSLAEKVKTLNECLGQTETRKVCGGIYSWQPGRLAKESEDEHKGRNPPDFGRKDWSAAAARSTKNFPSKIGLLPLSIMLTGTIASLLISGYVPPDGIDCRQITEVLIVLIWFASALCNSLLLRMFRVNKFGTNKKLFWLTYTKDLIATGLTMGGIVIVQVGILNRPICWTKWGRTGLALPQAYSISRVLNARLDNLYPAVTVTAVVVEFLLVPVLVWWRYRSAFRVFVQRDDGTSNAPDISSLKRKGSEITHTSKCNYCSMTRRRRRKERRGWLSSYKVSGVHRYSGRIAPLRLNYRHRSRNTEYLRSEQKPESNTLPATAQSELPPLKYHQSTADFGMILDEELGGIPYGSQKR